MHGALNAWHFFLYYHKKSGLHLAPYRAYDAELAVWLNEDPLGEEGGLNLYGYVANSPLMAVDPLRLEDFRMFPAGEIHKTYDSRSSSTYDIGSHGDSSSVFDEHSNPLSPQELLDKVRNDPDFQKAKSVKFWKKMPGIQCNVCDASPVPFPP